MFFFVQIREAACQLEEGTFHDVFPESNCSNHGLSILEFSRVHFLIYRSSPSQSASGLLCRLCQQQNSVWIHLSTQRGQFAWTMQESLLQNWTSVLRYVLFLFYKCENEEWILIFVANNEIKVFLLLIYKIKRMNRTRCEVEGVVMFLLFHNLILQLIYLRYLLEIV